MDCLLFRQLGERLFFTDNIFADYGVVGPALVLGSKRMQRRGKPLISAAFCGANAPVRFGSYAGE